MFTLRQLVEKRLEGQENMVLGFMDLVNIYDTVPREMAMATLRWMGVPEAEVRMVEGTHEESKGRVVCVGLRQGSGLSPLLFICGQQKNLDIRLDGKKLNQRQTFLPFRFSEMFTEIHLKLRYYGDG